MIINQNQMKFTAALLIAAVLYTETADARKRRGGGRKKKYAKVEGTVATCGVNLDKESWENGLAAGKTMFWQLDADVNEDGTVGDLKPVKVGSKWGNLAAEETHTFSFFDNDAEDCAGTALDATLGDGFTSDASGYGGIHGEFDTISLTGEQSIVGKYL